MKSFILIHGGIWHEGTSDLNLEPGLSLISLKNHPIINVYHEACTTGFHDKEPYDFYSGLMYDSNEFERAYDDKDPGSVINRALTLLSILMSSPVNLCVYIRCESDYSEYYEYYNLSHYADKSEYMQKGFYFSNPFNELLKIIYDNYISIRDEKKFNRIINAIDFFYYSWNSYFIEQACINISIIFETLFSPHSQNEISHQISLNVAKFLEEFDDMSEIEIYRKVKKFYGIRSKLVHGGFEKSSIRLEIIPFGFSIASTILTKILLSKEDTQVFSDDKARIRLFESYIFK